MKPILPLSAVAALLCISSFAASNPGVYARYQGYQLVTELLGTPGTPKSGQEPNVTYAQRYAEGYMAGIADATQGKVWCAPPILKEGEIDERVYLALRALPADQLKRNAATLVLDHLSTTFPCPARRLP